MRCRASSTSAFARGSGHSSTSSASGRRTSGQRKAAWSTSGWTTRSSPRAAGCGHLTAFHLYPGLYGVADVVEYIRSEDGVSLPGREGLWAMRPVEYKRGKPKIDERDEVQLCAQAICLEEMFGVRVERGDFYYNEIRRRVPLLLSPELRERVCSLSEEMHDLFAKGVTPSADASRKCNLCSLQNICMPKLTKKTLSVRTYVRKHVKDACVEDV